ncbi:MAG: hypothetical protein AAFY57_06660 [Cyanobacteria bacterium J06642_2]
MAEIRLGIEGAAAVAASEALFQIEDVSGKWLPTSDEPEREGVLATIATIVGITAGTLTVAEKIYKWYRAWSERESPNPSIEKVVLVGRNGQRILLKGASVEDIKRLLDA